jgi:ubiquitin C-terminal hydrolase
MTRRSTRSNIAAAAIVSRWGSVNETQRPHAQPVVAEWSVGAGLQNYGYTCYVNAALQCMAHCPEFGSLVVADSGLHGFQCAFPGCRACMLETVLRQLLRGARNTVVHPAKLVNNLISFGQQFLRGVQEDRCAWSACGRLAMCWCYVLPMM